MSGDINSVNHMGIAVRDLEKACSLYEQLGFTLSPLSVHSGSKAPGEPPVPMATGNRCAIFPNNYIEVLGIVNPGAMDWGWERFLDKFQGAHIICFGCTDAEEVRRRLDDSKVANSGVITLQRDIGTEEGMRTARFDCVHVDGAGTPEGLIQAARHHNPEYLHQPRYLNHANGATSLTEILLVSENPEQTAAHYAVLSGQASTRQEDGSFLIRLPLVTALRFMGPEQAGKYLPGTLMAPAPAMVAATFSVRDLGAARELVVKAGFPVVDGPGRFMVPAEAALGVAHLFRQE